MPTQARFGRIIFRLSGTGSSGATIRMYIDKYCPPTDKAGLTMPAGEALAPLVDIAVRVADIENLTGRKEPTVIT